MSSKDGFDDIDDAFTARTAKPDTGQEKEKDEDDYTFPHVFAWVTEWLAPATAFKLSDGGRGRVWCARWFEHPPVVVRLHTLWLSWEKATRSSDDKALHSWFVYDYDAAMARLTDGESGPMYACSPTKHRDIPTLPVDPVPAEFLLITVNPQDFLTGSTVPADPTQN